MYTYIITSPASLRSIMKIRGHGDEETIILAKEPSFSTRFATRSYKKRNILQNRPRNLEILLIIPTPVATQMKEGVAEGPWWLGCISNELVNPK